MNGKHLFAAGISVVVAIVLYTLLFFYKTKPDRVYTVEPHAYREFNDEVREVLQDIQQDPERGKEKFLKLSRTIHGGEQWLLLKMAAIDNRGREYDAVKNKEKPIIVLSQGIGPDPENNCWFTVTVSNLGSTYINIPAIPSSIEWVFTGSGNTEYVLQGDRGLFGNITEKQIMKLQPQSFWGITLPVKKHMIRPGPWEVKARFSYKRDNGNGLNIIHGTFTSNSVKVNQ
jgi:hypothetical protein